MALEMQLATFKTEIEHLRWNFPYFKMEFDINRNVILK